MQVVQIPLPEWNRVVRIITRLDREERTRPRKEWLTAAQFKARHNLTSQQIRYLREKHVDLVKAQESGRYLYDNAYYNRLQASS